MINILYYWQSLRLKSSSFEWHLNHLSVARLVALKSKDPSTQCGAVIVDKYNRPVSWGINGFPRKLKDDSRLHDRKVKYPIILHAEENAILFAKRDLTDCSIYVWPSQPCAHCASFISQSGINFVGFPKKDFSVKDFSVKDFSINDRWKENYKLSRKTLKESKIRFKCFSVKLLDSYMSRL